MDAIKSQKFDYYERKYHIDFLKTLGMLLLIFAHVQAPTFLETVRVFDVPLMVFLSGMISTNSYKKSGNSVKYFWKRLERLVIPSWIFLIGFYISMWAVHQLPDALTILKSFAFQRDCGIAGGVWIILIYLWCAVLMPLLQRITQMKYYWFLIFALTIIYQVLIYTTGLTESRLFYYTLFSAVPYGIFMSLGIKYETLSLRGKIELFFIAMCLLTLSTLFIFIRFGCLKSPADYKYPAQFYFFIYALPIIIALIETCKELEKYMLRLKLIQFVSMHSLWVYLWHIFFLAVFNYVLCISSWLLEYVGIVTFSIMTTWLQNLIINKLSQKKKFYVFKYFIC